MKELWSNILSTLGEMLPEGKVKVFLEPLKGKVVRLAPERESAQGSLVASPSYEWEVRLTAANDFMASQVRDQFSQAIAEAGRIVLGSLPKVSVKASTSRAKAELPKPVNAEELAKSIPTAPGVLVSRGQQLDLPFAMPRVRAFNPASALRGFKHSFDDFVVGPCNAMAVAAAKDICHDGGCVETLFVSSASGLGKTHIMQSVGRAVQEQGGQARLAYLSAEDLASRYVAALRSNDVESFRARLRDLDVLLLEDVHFLQGKEKMQDMVLTVIKSLQDRGGRAIFTSSFSPRELEKLDSQLVSHFCSGIVSPLERPDTEMCRHILERKAKSFQVLLPDEVCDLLAGRLQGDVRQLESCLKSLVFKARMLNCGLNPELALEVLQQYATVDCGPDFASIVRLVCESYGLNERQLASRSHKQQYVLARNTIYYLARKHTDMSLKEIGERFNRRHSTVIKGITSLEREIANESRVGRQISRAVELIERNAGIRPEMSLAGKVPAARHAAPSLLSL